MILTGKCKEEFNKELGAYKENFNDLPIAGRNSLIIEFFDSVGICIMLFDDIDNKVNSCIDCCENCDNCFDYYVMKYYYSVYFFSKIDKGVNNYQCFNQKEDSFDTRQQATTEAIKKANEIFNNR